MAVELKNWAKICEEKDQRIKELEGKFDLIVDILEKNINPLNNPNWNAGIIAAISIVEHIGGVKNE